MPRVAGVITVRVVWSSGGLPMTATAVATLRPYVDRATEAFERGRFGNDKTGRGDDHGQLHEDLVGRRNDVAGDAAEPVVGWFGEVV
jgi:hypothetical protein